MKITGGRVALTKSTLLWSGLVAVSLLLALASVLSLRQNNLNMVQLRNDLVAMDQTGDVAQVQSAARKLQNYVANHMNTATGKVALQTLYDQAADQAMTASKPADIADDVYQQATSDCRPQLDLYGYRAWVSCVAIKVGINNSATLTSSDVTPPDPDLYYIEYVPARWSFDLAGICLLLFTVVLAVLMLRLMWLVYQKVRHYCCKRIEKVSYRC